jgi:hypothetical protein
MNNFLNNYQFKSQPIQQPIQQQTSLPVQQNQSYFNQLPNLAPVQSVGFPLPVNPRAIDGGIIIQPPMNYSHQMPTNYSQQSIRTQSQQHQSQQQHSQQPSIRTQSLPQQVQQRPIQQQPVVQQPQQQSQVQQQQQGPPVIKRPMKKKPIANTYEKPKNILQSIPKTSQDISKKTYKSRIEICSMEELKAREDRMINGFSDRVLDDFSKNVGTFAKIDLMIKRLKKKIEPIQAQIKELKQYKADVQKSLCSFMGTNDIEACNISKKSKAAEADIDMEAIKYVKKEHVLPLTQQRIQDGLHAFYTNNIDKREEFLRLRSEDKAQYIFKYIQDHRPKELRESIKPVSKHVESAEILDEFELFDFTKY